MTTALNSRLYHGSVRHRRTKPSPHEFRYPISQCLLDLDELPEIEKQIPFFGYNRNSWSSIFDSDYMGKEERPIREKLVTWLRARGKDVPGRVLLLTSPRVLGHGFNPVSYYYVLDGHDRLDFAVAEINNTFGESYAYLLEGGDSGTQIVSKFPKVFHVSPFIAIRDLSYCFRLTAPRKTLSVHIDEYEKDQKFFDATMFLEREEFTRGNLARALVTNLHFPLRVITWIHWEALKLWLKRIPVFTKPVPPEDVLSRKTA